MLLKKCYSVITSCYILWSKATCKRRANISRSGGSLMTYMAHFIFWSGITFAYDKMLIRILLKWLNAVKIIWSTIHKYQHSPLKKHSPSRALPGQQGAIIPQYSIIMGFLAQTQAAHRQPAATLITQHHLHKKVTDLSAIISRRTMPYNWALATEAAGQRSPNGSDAKLKLGSFSSGTSTLLRL